MPWPATWRQHRLGWILLVVAATVLVLLAALAIRVSALLRPERFTSLLEHQLANAGMTLELQAPARPALFPRPAVHLQGFSLANAGSATPILRADGATIVVPWGALVHSAVAIERVDVDAPSVDLGQLRELLARLPRGHGPPRLPTILTGVHFNDGTLTHAGNPVLFGVDLDTGRLVAGQPFRVDLTASGADGIPVRASLGLVPAPPHAGVIALDDVDLAIHRQGGFELALQGRGDWRGGEAVSLQLAGTLAYPTSPPPAAATTASTAASAAPPATTTDKLALDVHPAADKTPLTVALLLTGANANANLTLRPTELGAWWSRLLTVAPGHPPGPLPVTGKATVTRLDLGSLHATGLTIDAESDVAPASAASGAAPAATAAPVASTAPAANSARDPRDPR